MHMLEKPVLFDVTEHKGTSFRISRCSIGWKSRFYLMSRNFSRTIASRRSTRLEKPVLFDVTERSSKGRPLWGLRWKSRFYLMSRNKYGAFEESETGVGKAGFIWCHGTPLEDHDFHWKLLEKPVLFDVTELHNPFNIIRINGWKSRFYLMSRNLTSIYPNYDWFVGKAGFIWCHGTRLG